MAGASGAARRGGLGRVSPDRNLRVLVVDDHDVVHWGFRLLLTEQPWVERCLAASSVDEAMEMARRYEPHVSLVDLFLGEGSGAELCEAIRRVSPSTRVLLISGVGWISPQAAKAAGASGFVSKDSSAHDVAMAVRMVGKGMTVFAPRSEQPPAPLSDREREVLSLMASGATNKEIAERLFLSPHTVKEHTSALYRKLKVRNRAEAVRRAERLGLTA
jgi:DNA-binding NarL/FixJ family response regulator